MFLPPPLANNHYNCMSRELKGLIAIGTAVLFTILFVVCASAQTYTFEHWTCRQVKESALFGGQTRTLYSISSPWTTSNVHAQIMGTNKAAVSVYSTDHNGGKACLLKIEQVDFSVMGVPVHVIASGSIFLGETIAPSNMKEASDPMSALNMNYAYSERPAVLYFDYEAQIEQSNVISQAHVSKRVRHYEGRDGASVTLLLQRRWEDTDGHVHATRIATATVRFYQSSNGWVSHFALPLRYGDITQQPDFQDYEALNRHGFMVRNSRGKMVAIEEHDFNADAQPTHLILLFSSGCQPVYSGHVGNCFKVDNVRLL